MSRQFYRETQIADGPLLVSHAMPESQSVALGIFIDVGSRDEAESQSGITHALEHMLFKGAGDLDVERLAEQLDDLGGNANAFTSRERTCFHLHVLHEAWPQALKLLTDMVQQPLLPHDEWLREREVIFSEMAMIEDSPEEWIADQHVAALFADHVIGRPILGSIEALRSMTSNDLRSYLDHWYCPPRMLIAAAGNIDHDALVNQLAAVRWRATDVNTYQREPAPVISSGIQPLAREGEQAQIIVSMPGIEAASAQRPAAWLANQVLGGGMSSRLFREVRERRGLAYSVGSHLNSLADIGSWSVTCGTDPDRAAECVALIGDQLNCFADSLTENDLARARRQLEVQLRMGVDSVEGQMLYLGSRLDEASLISPLEWVEQLQQTGLDAVRQWAAERVAAGRLWSVAAPSRALDKICDSIAP